MKRNSWGLVNWLFIIACGCGFGLMTVGSYDHDWPMLLVGFVLISGSISAYLVRDGKKA